MAVRFGGLPDVPLRIGTSRAIQERADDRLTRAADAPARNRFTVPVGKNGPARVWRGPIPRISDRWGRGVRAAAPNRGAIRPLNVAGAAELLGKARSTNGSGRFSATQAQRWDKAKDHPAKLRSGLRLHESGRWDWNPRPSAWKADGQHRVTVVE